VDQTGFDDLQSTLSGNTLQDVYADLQDLIKEYGIDNINTIYAKLKETTSYKNRFAGNEMLKQQGFVPLSEYEYIQAEKALEVTFTSYGAKDLATHENKAKLIGGSISNSEIADRFKTVQTRIDNAYKSNDSYFIKQLNAMYPGINDSDIMKSMILGKDGADYLKNRLSIADIKAAEDQTGIKSAYGSEYLAGQGVTREAAVSGLATTREQTAGVLSAANVYGENVDATEVQKQLESENIFGAQSAGKTKRLASQVRGEFSGASGVQSGSLKTTKQGSI